LHRPKKEIKTKLQSMPRVMLLLLLFVTSNVYSQEYGLRSYIGSMHYMGDLAPLSANLSASRAHIATKVSHTIKVNEIVTYFSSVVIGKVSGDDALSADPARKRRNLSFESNIYEFGVGMEISFVSLIPKIGKYGIDVFMTGGISTFHMNPRTLYEGHWYKLQALGTEGQGLDLKDSNFENWPFIDDSFYKDKYKLWQLAFPFGVGCSFKINDRFSFGLEIVPRFTLTDYLDDVSSNYLATSFQSEIQGPTIARLANRSGIDYANSGAMRGDSNDKDWYIFNSLTFVMSLANIDRKIKKKRS